MLFLVLLHLHPGPVQQNLDYVALFGALVYGVCAQAPALCERHTVMQNRYSKDSPPPSFNLLWPPATRRAVTWTAQQWNQRVQVGSKIIYWPVAGEPQARIDWTQGEAVDLPGEEVVVPTRSSGRVSIAHTIPLGAISGEQASFIVFHAFPALYSELEDQLENSASTESAMQRIFAMRKGIETAMGMVGYGTATSLWLQKLLDLDVGKANQGTRERVLPESSDRFKVELAYSKLLAGESFAGFVLSPEDCTGPLHDAAGKYIGEGFGGWKVRVHHPGDNAFRSYLHKVANEERDVAMMKAADWVVEHLTTGRFGEKEEPDESPSIPPAPAKKTLRPTVKAVPRVQELKADETHASRKNSTDNLWEDLRGFLFERCPNSMTLHALDEICGDLVEQVDSIWDEHEKLHGKRNPMTREDGRAFRAEFSDAEGNVLNTWRFTIHNYTLQACQRIALEMSMAVVASDEAIECVSVTCETTGRVCVDDRGF